MRSTPELGLPTTPASRLQAVGDACALGPRAMFFAGGFALAGDLLLTTAFLALVLRRSLPGSDLEPFGWTLLALAAGIAMVFGSMMAVPFGCVVFAAFGVQRWRHARHRRVAVPMAAPLAPDPSR